MNRQSLTNPTRKGAGGPRPARPPAAVNGSQTGIEHQRVHQLHPGRTLALAPVQALAHGHTLLLTGELHHLSAHRSAWSRPRRG